MVSPSTQTIILPEIPGLYDENFLDIQLPAKGDGSTIGRLGVVCKPILRRGKKMSLGRRRFCDYHGSVTEVER